MKKLTLILLILVFLLSMGIGYVASSSGIDVLDRIGQLIGLDSSDSKKSKNAENTPKMQNIDGTQRKITKEDIQAVGPVTLSLVGDILLDSSVGRLINQKGADFIMSDVMPIMKSSDILMANLENPIGTKGTKEQNKQFTFRAKPDSVNALTSAGLDIVSLANNHILDYGTEAMEETLGILDKNSISHVGAGQDINSASKPFFIKKNGNTIAFIASTHIIPSTTWAAGVQKPGVATTYDPTRIRAEISKARQKAGIVVVYIHWGEEMRVLPVSYQRNLAKIYIDEGADIVVGSHPHVLEGLEFYKGKLIAYSLGNFVFTNWKSNTMILNIKVKSNKINEVKIIPCQISNYRPKPIVNTISYNEALNKLRSISFNVKIGINGTVTQK
jgi:poly-gamma-glutamate capsule biosynthesis protein CapA/YwtB (metallophosphatase superfamily)